MEQIQCDTYEFDDVLIYPIPSSVSSRDDVDISVKLSEKVILKFPLVTSPMVGVVDGMFAKKLSDLGGMAILHRFYKNREVFVNDIIQNLSDKDCFGISVKVDQPDYKELIDLTGASLILVDTANGYTKRVLKYCEQIKDYIVNIDSDVLLMAGNVATKDGCNNLYNAGCDIIRLGIGGGSPCSTRNVTGIGVPNISALMECDYPNRGYKLMIDGGIRNSGDFVKSIVAGADFAMSGKLFAECYESPNEGILYGMASRTHMENTKAEIKSVEGFDISITKKQSLADFVKEFGYGIKSAGTYLNAHDLNEIYVNGKFIKVSDSAIKKGV